MEGDVVETVFKSRAPISIHALRVEGDQKMHPQKSARRIFLSTPSGWRATFSFQFAGGTRFISIHALRVEGDTRSLPRWQSAQNFYPRPPGGGRLKIMKVLTTWYCIFLSTPSGWRATIIFSNGGVNTQIYFYPRPPGGGRHDEKPAACPLG